MANIYVKLVLFTLIFIAIVSLLADNIVDGKGGRGGGFRGGFRGTRGYRGVRRSRSYRSSRRTGIRSTRLSPAGSLKNNLRTSGYWKYAAGAGLIYGWARYSHGPRYRSHPDTRPQICINLYDYSSDNGTKQQMFICPLANQGADYKYCCGPEDRERCCKFWDNGGRVFGVVVGILIFFAVIGLVLYCCCCKQKKKPGFIQSFTKKETKYAMTGSQPAPPDVAPSYPQGNVPPQNAPYPTGPQAPAPYPATPADGAYNKPAYPPGPEATPYPAANTPPPPYPIAPAGGAPYPPGGAPYPPQPNNPYPPPQPNGDAPYPPPVQGEGALPYGVEPQGGPYPNTAAPPPYPAN